VDDLTRTLERVAEGGTAMDAIRQAAPRTAERYHPKRTADRLQAVLDRVVAGSARP
jgi:hypothetical protein